MTRGDWVSTGTSSRLVGVIRPRLEVWGSICEAPELKRVVHSSSMLRPLEKMRRGTLLLSIFYTFCCNFLVHVHVHAQTPYSSNPNDYDFGWLVNGVYSAGSVPFCAYCVNALQNLTLPPGGPDWNRTVGMYRCDGLQTNELWAYHNTTQTIVYSNLTSQILCIDSQGWNTSNTLNLRQCNPSLSSQRWIRDRGHLVNGLTTATGEPLYLVGQFPDKATDPTNHDYHYKLGINPSTDPAPEDDFPWTSTFTFLSTGNLVDKSTNTFTTEGLFKVSNSSVDQIANGGFEYGTIQAGADISPSTSVQHQPSYFALCGWVIDLGPIEYVKSGYLGAKDGSYSVHLNALTNMGYSGSISQTLGTEIGKEYLLSFFLNGFPRTSRNCSSTYTEALLRVHVTNASSIDSVLPGESTGTTRLESDFTFDTTNSNAVNFGDKWNQTNVSFKALSNITRISFTSLNYNDSCGPMIDAVSLQYFPRHSGGTSKIAWIVVGSLGAVAIVIGSVVGFICRRRYRGAEDEFSSLYKIENARVFSVKEISGATNKFSSVLGEGGFGTVYKAAFPDGTLGAVKVEKPRGMKSSKVLASEEIAVLLRVHHRNLVNLTGFCIHKGQHMLVFEYLPNGNLHDRLHQPVLSISPDRSKDPPPGSQIPFSEVLPWEKRVKIACDVAYGLEYLHHDADPPIVHRDVKSQNILLTTTDSAKLADFGLSKAAPADATAFQSFETAVRGSIGYLDPQYFLTGVFSTKSDVYSYGVVLLELISGHPAIYNGSAVASWAAPYLVDPARYHELVDEKLKGVFDPTELQTLVELSKMCIQEESKLRPNMRQVVTFLRSNQLGAVGDESCDQVEDALYQVEDALLREKYHKMHPLFLDSESVSQDSFSSETPLYVKTEPQEGHVLKEPASSIYEVSHGRSSLDSSGHHQLRRTEK